MQRRHIRAALAAVLTMAGGLVQAQGPAMGYPSAPVKLLLPQPAGSGTDVIIRLITDRMGAALKQPFVIDNRPGASGALAAEAAARSAPDGYTLFACTSTTHVMLPLVSPKLGYDAVKDFSPVGIISKADNLLIVPAASPFKTVAELIAYGKAHEGKLSYGTAGMGTTHQLAAELLQHQGGFEAVHIPYKGTPLAEGDLVSGRLDFMINNAAPALANIKAGRTRALMVTSANRSPELPNVPTSREAGLQDFEVYGFTALCAPAGTPGAVIERLNAEMTKAVNAPEVREQLLKFGFDGKPTTPDEQTAYIRSESQRWSSVIKAKRLKFW
jgi:tripartite-type tricarboxylate transporter receptor subunit TctC